jgi:hypothetical protein
LTLRTARRLKEYDMTDLAKPTRADKSALGGAQ